MAIVATGVLLAYRAGWTTGRSFAAGAAIAYLLLEARYGRLTRDDMWLQVLLGSGILGSALSAAYLRSTLDAREAGIGEALAVAEAGAGEARLARRLASHRQLTTLQYELERARRHGHSLTLLLVRPDELEDIGERYGPHGTRAALERLADAVGENVRATDLPVPEEELEFAVILPETPLDDGRIVAERIRLAANDLLLDFGPGELVELSVSIGVAGFPEDASTDDALAGAARRALLRAVELGGNRTLLHSAPAGVPAGWAIEAAEVRPAPRLAP